LKLVVIGAGAMGLAAARQAARRGLDVEAVEAGGRTCETVADLDFDVLSMERYRSGDRSWLPPALYAPFSL